jgi:hypothetical protein
LAQPDYKRLVRILRDCGRRGWTSKSQRVDFAYDPPLIDFTDILTCKCHLCWYRHSLLGEDLPRSLFEGVFRINVCQAAKDVGASEEALADLFDRIENFFKRLESYTKVPATTAMTEIIVKIMAEVLNIFAIATKEIKQGRASE